MPDSTLKLQKVAAVEVFYCLKGELKSVKIIYSDTYLVVKKGINLCVGVGNNLESIAFAFLVALLSGRAFLLEYTWPYTVTQSFKPDIDWIYHQNPRNHPNLISEAVNIGNFPSSDWTRVFEFYFRILNVI
jgi:hypothetical protein